MKIMITGFDAFGGETRNPSSEVLALLRAPAGAELILKPEIPTEFGVGRLVCRYLSEEQPDVLLCLGQAGGRRGLTPERVAINIMDAGIPDNRGFLPSDLPVEPGGKNAYFSTLPIKAMVSAMEKAGIPASVSNSAGTFVCNSLLYHVLSYIEGNRLPVRAGFLHVPFLPEQAENHPGYPAMSLEDMAEGISAALEAIVCSRDD